MSDATDASSAEDPMVTHLVNEITEARTALARPDLGPGDRYRLEIRLSNAKNDLARLDEAFLRSLDLS